MSRPNSILLTSNVVGYIILVAINVLSGLGVFGGTNAGISKKFDTPLTPAGWAFSIWGIIFALQGFGVLYALVGHGYGSDGSKTRVINSIGYWWQCGWYAEVAWQLFFVRQTPGSMIACMLFLFAALGSFALALRQLYSLTDDFLPPSTTLLYVGYLLPTSLNTAWLSVASCLGVLIVAKAYGVAASSLTVPAALLAALVTAVGFTVVYKKRDTAYALTLVWALLAVFGRKHGVPEMRWSAFVCMVVMCVASIGSVLRRNQYRDPAREPLRASQLLDC